MVFEFLMKPWINFWTLYIHATLQDSLLHWVEWLHRVTCFVCRKTGERFCCWEVEGRVLKRRLVLVELIHKEGELSFGFGFGWAAPQRGWAELLSWERWGRAEDEVRRRFTMSEVNWRGDYCNLSTRSQSFFRPLFLFVALTTTNKNSWLIWAEKLACYCQKGWMDV